MDALVVGEVVHRPLRGDDRLGLNIGQQQREWILLKSTESTHRRSVGQHHDHYAVEVLGVEVSNDLFDVIAVACRSGEDDVGGGRELFTEGL